MKGWVVIGWCRDWHCCRHHLRRLRRNLPRDIAAVEKGIRAAIVASQPLGVKADPLVGGADK